MSEGTQDPLAQAQRQIDTERAELELWFTEAKKEVRTAEDRERLVVRFVCRRFVSLAKLFLIASRNINLPADEIRETLRRERSRIIDETFASKRMRPPGRFNLVGKIGWIEARQAFTSNAENRIVNSPEWQQIDAEIEKRAERQLKELQAEIGGEPIEEDTISGQPMLSSLVGPQASKLTPTAAGDGISETDSLQPPRPNKMEFMAASHTEDRLLTESLEWEDIELSFVGDHDVEVRIAGAEAQKLHYKKIQGFENRKNGKPSQLWVMLRVFSTFQEGIMPDQAHNSKGWLATQKTIERTSKALRLYFGMTGDPFPYIRGTGYRARIKLRSESDPPR